MQKKQYRLQLHLRDIVFMANSMANPYRHANCVIDIVARVYAFCRNIARKCIWWAASRHNCVSIFHWQTKAITETQLNAQTQHEEMQFEAADIIGGLYREGIIARKGAFERAWVERLRADIDVLFEEAKSIPGGALNRGPNRFYVEVHPQRLRGFIDLASHPWVVAVCTNVLGPDYRIVEIGFDVPGPGAENQPWHRDFPTPEATAHGRRLNSLAFNMTTVDITDEMGPLEIAPGTQWDDLSGFSDSSGMFPVRELYPRYEARAQRKKPVMGDISARSALTIHRGTANRSPFQRPVLVLGVDAPDARNAERHDLQVTRDYWNGLPAQVRDHLTCRIVDKLEHIVQKHTIEGLKMGV